MPTTTQLRNALTAGVGRLRQSQIYQQGVFGQTPRVPTSWTGLESMAQRRLSPKSYAYIAGGAGNEETQRENMAAFARWSLVPRVLRDVSRREIGITLFGRRLATPVLLAPVGALGLVHPEADRAVAAAAAEHGVPYIFSNQASRSMEECAAVMGEAPRWFQLYWSTSDDLVRSLVGRAERSGCEAIVVTLDTTMLGWRPRDLDLGSLPFALGEGIAQYTSDPVFLELAGARSASAAPKPSLQQLPSAIRALLSMTRKFPGDFRENLRSPMPRAAVQTFLDVYSRPSLSWSDLAELRAMTSLPIVLKGVQHSGDARLALDHGADGIIVSNHGGRQVDGGRAAIDSLPDVVDAVDGRIPVLMDSGVRGGADILKALALGATAVCIGRPYAYGLGLAGQQGVSEVISNFVAEFDLTLGLCGLTSVSQIGPDLLERR